MNLTRQPGNYVERADQRKQQRDRRRNPGYLALVLFGGRRAEQGDDERRAEQGQGDEEVAPGLPVHKDPTSQGHAYRLEYLLKRGFGFFRSAEPR